MRGWHVKVENLTETEFIDPSTNPTPPSKQCWVENFLKGFGENQIQTIMKKAEI